LRGSPFFDTANDGTPNTAAEVVSLDTDGDGLITFVDLNAPALQCLCAPGPPPHPPGSCGAGLSCDFHPAGNPDGRITPLDLVDGNCTADDCQANGRFQDSEDNDGTGKEDDLVGWNFDGRNNLPTVPAPSEGDTPCSGNSHDVGTAGIIAAAGAPPVVPPMTCGSTLVAGMNWAAQLIPIRLKLEADAKDATRSSAYMAMRYAAGLGADAINASWGITFDNSNNASCFFTVKDFKTVSYETLRGKLEQEGRSLDLMNSVLVAAVENCTQNDDDTSARFDWPAALSNPNILSVGAIFTNTTMMQLPRERASNTAFGPATVDIAAPGTEHTLLKAGGDVNTGCFGTSFAAPMVTGAIGLILSTNPPPPIRGNPAAVINRVLCNADVEPQLASVYAGGGRVLNVAAAVQNTNNCMP
jgi:subtilisin family serine protease